MTAFHWGHFWLGVLCAYTVPWVVLGLFLGACRWAQRRRNRAVVRWLIRETAGR